MKDLRGYVSEERRAVVFGSIWFVVGLAAIWLLASL